MRDGGEDACEDFGGYELDMPEEKCECGHLKSEHQEWTWLKPKEEGGRTALRWVAPGQGSCSKCKCPEFKKEDILRIEDYTDAELEKSIKLHEAEIEKDRKTEFLNVRPELKKGLEKKEKFLKKLYEELDRRRRSKKA